MKYTIRGNRNKGFVITDEHDQSYGRVDYTNWFSRKAVISLSTQENYEIVPSGFWQTSFDILKSEHKVGEIRMNWRGNMILDVQEKSYMLKRSGFWQRQLELSSNQEEIASIRQTYEWTKLGYSFDVTLKSTDMTPKIALLLLVTTYCANQQYAGSGIA
ncbi:MAG: hypothetical protein K0R82_253 [Flavipsychrobacter sp.]|jgi:hypothetical protein|nr:hypothetical protein [Flavipsychrobacter sp.]